MECSWILKDCSYFYIKIEEILKKKLHLILQDLQWWPRNATFLYPHCDLLNYKLLFCRIIIGNWLKWLYLESQKSLNKIERFFHFDLQQWTIIIPDRVSTSVQLSKDEIHYSCTETPVIRRSQIYKIETRIWKTIILLYKESPPPHYILTRFGIKKRCIFLQYKETLPSPHQAILFPLNLGSGLSYKV